MRCSFFVNGEMGMRLITWVAENHKDDISVIISYENQYELESLAKSLRVPYLCLDSDEISEIELSNKLRLMEIDIGYLLWWPKIISSSLINATKFGFLNLHPSFLPNGRGKNPNFWAIVSGEQFGVTIHWVDKKIDNGPVFAQKMIDVYWFDNGKTLYEKSLQELFLLFTETYATISKLEFSQVTKNSCLVNGSFHNEINMTEASQIVLDQKYVARDLLNLLRARTFEGKPGCTFSENGQRYSVRIEITEV